MEWNRMGMRCSLNQELIQLFQFVNEPVAKDDISIMNTHTEFSMQNAFHFDKNGN